jgi:hypothetical protein
MGLFKEIVSQAAGRDLRNVLVLSNRGYFVFAQTAKRDAIFQGNHDALPEHSITYCIG